MEVLLEAVLDEFGKGSEDDTNGAAEGALGNGSESIKGHDAYESEAMSLPSYAVFGSEFVSVVLALPC